MEILETKKASTVKSLAQLKRYEEDVAIKISSRVKNYYEVMQKITDKL
jgi:hypothetical protein